MPVPPGKGPFVDARRVGAWDVRVRSEIGPVRERLEDAWRVVADLKFGRRTVHALAVFDGVGGMPHGQEAAWAAADGLEAAIQAAGGLDNALATLQPRVLATGGATTAIIALLDRVDHGQGAIACVGDSSAYTLDEGQGLQRITPRDSLGPNWITDYLGNKDMEGHVFPFRLQKSAPLLLCTDGVDSVAKPASLENLLRAPEGALDAELDLLFDEIHDGGEPDNATLVLAAPRTEGKV